jgi:murein DD-endopeptidase MepM/ murein hydrolase activator NlpD
MKFFTVLALLSLRPLCAAPEDRITLSNRSDPSGATVIMARNHDLLLPRYIQLTLQDAVNISPDRGLPVRSFLRPGERRDILVLRQTSPQLGYSYHTLYNEGFGNPEAMPDLSVAYLLPYEHGTRHLIGQGYLGNVTHQGLYALDFDMPDGTTICAARDGIVAMVKDDSDSGGPSPQFASQANEVDILHADGTWAAYAHLKLHGALVQKGQRVKAGQPIGLSGHTGQASGPHLHFSVQKPRWDGQPETFATPFAYDGQKTIYLQEGKEYYSWHPDGPAFARVDPTQYDDAALDSKVVPYHGAGVRLRQQQIGAIVLYFADNSMDQSVAVTFDLEAKGEVRPSKPTPFKKVVPPHSEAYLLHAYMGAQSSCLARFHYDTLPHP